MIQLNCNGVISSGSIAVNLLLSAGKLAAGLIAHSGAMVSDAVHSASDIFSTLIVMVGLRLSGKAADREHPYGHERMECVAAIVLAGVLLVTGLLIGYQGAREILSVEATGEHRAAADHHRLAAGNRQTCDLLRGSERRP